MTVSLSRVDSSTSKCYDAFEFQIYNAIVLDRIRREYLELKKKINKGLYQLHEKLIGKAQIPDPDTDGYPFTRDIQANHQSYCDLYQRHNRYTYYNSINGFIGRDRTFLMLGILKTPKPIRGSELYHRLVDVESWVKEMDHEEDFYQLLTQKLDLILEPPALPPYERGRE